ncbi:MAG: hypothetical protein U0R76_07675 [Candidatus Nanopelagicales bacterium]
MTPESRSTWPRAARFDLHLVQRRGGEDFLEAQRQRGQGRAQLVRHLAGHPALVLEERVEPEDAEVEHLGHRIDLRDAVPLPDAARVSLRLDIRAACSAKSSSGFTSRFV